MEHAACSRSVSTAGLAKYTVCQARNTELLRRRSSPAQTADAAQQLVLPCEHELVWRSSLQKPPSAITLCNTPLSQERVVRRAPQQQKEQRPVPPHAIEART